MSTTSWTPNDYSNIITIGRDRRGAAVRHDRGEGEHQACPRSEGGGAAEEVTRQKEGSAGGQGPLAVACGAQGEEGHAEA